MTALLQPGPTIGLAGQTAGSKDDCERPPLLFLKSLIPLSLRPRTQDLQRKRAFTTGAPNNVDAGIIEGVPDVPGFD